MKKVVVIGPESTGKSTLSAFLAEHYKTEWVPEYARLFIANLDRPYTASDLVTIAQGQLKLEDEIANRVDHLLICDTDLLVIKIWAEHKYNSCQPVILQMIEERTYDLYLLTNIDMPWEEDPQRENPHLREHFMNIFEEEIKKTNVPYVKVSGNFNERQQTAIEAIDRLLQQKSR
ncbi:ATPase [Fulvivirga sp. RKSG066]|uniref:AAA family ATPase n=1 Tax=Fulvivirga aurantia TaxID=2529383 RepID=UPI0012BC9DD8|nr:ATP-binding protein [Fulvivirga aurantia]MTI23299.1 ATPase [Fulvivirga aurantia]